MSFYDAVVRAMEEARMAEAIAETERTLERRDKRYAEILEQICALGMAAVQEHEHKLKQQHAHAAVRLAVHVGLLRRPLRCMGCDKFSTSLDAHHADYNKPLDVIWLCRRCHRIIDAAKQRRERRLKREAEDRR